MPILSPAISAARGPRAVAPTEGLRHASRAQQRLAEEERQQLRAFDAALSTVQDLVIVLDPSGRARYVNRALLDLLQRSPEGAVGRTFSELDYPPALAERLQRQVQEVVDAARPVTGEAPFAAAQGLRDHAYAFAPVLGEHGEVIAVVGRSHGVGERKEARRRIDGLLATLGHELRNPLAPIRASLAALRMAGDATPAAERLHATIERQVSHLVHLVDGLLEASRISRGRIELRRRRVDLGAIVDGALEATRPLIDNAGQRLTVSLPSAPLAVDADPVRIAQALANVLDNAAKYTCDRGEIQLEVRQEGSAALVSVRDHGLGIEAELLPRVFDMFTQAAPGQGGLGLGLSVARQLLELHGGSIEASSEGPGRGSEFVLRLPLAEGSAAEEAPGQPPGSAPMAQRRILVVDDNRDAADSLALLLQLDGHDVRIAYDGTSALQEAARQPPDVVLLDLGMPGMDGFEVARRLRAQAAGGELRLVALTGWDHSDARSRSEAAGIDHHLLKPVELDALNAVLGRSGEAPERR